MKRNAVAILLLVAALVAGVVVVLLRPPTALVGPRVNSWLIGKVKQSTGRDLAIQGPTSVSLFPRARLKIGDVTLSGPAGKTGESLLRAKSIDASGNLFALLRGNLDFDSVRVEEPVIALGIDDKGKPNWTFDVPGQTAFSIASLEVTRAALTYADARTGALAKASDVEGVLKEVSRNRVGAINLKNGPLSLSSGSDAASLAASIDRGSLEVDDLKYDSVARWAVGGNKIALKTRDDAHAISLDGATVSASKVTNDEIGVLSMNAAAARYAQAGGTVVATVERGTMQSEGVRRNGVARVTLGAGQLGLRTRDDQQALTLDGLSANAEKVTSDAIGTLALKSAAARYAQAGGTIVAARSVDASVNALTADKVGAVALAADRIGLANPDERPGFELAKFETRSAGGAYAGPLASDFAFDWNRERVTGNVKLASPATLNETKPIPIVITLAARGGTMTIDGTVSGGSNVDGKAVFAAKSLRDLGSWLGADLPKQGPLAATRLEGKIAAGPKRIAFSDAEMSLDATKAKGSLAVDLTGARPKLSGTIAADLFDADAYGLGTAPPKKRDVAAPSASVEAAANEPPAVSLKDALKVYLRKQLQGLAQPAAAAAALDPTVDELSGGAEAQAAAAKKRPAATTWSDAPIDLSPLKTVDLDMAVSVGKLKWSGIEMGVPEAKARLNDGSLAFETRNLEVKGGKVTGRADIDSKSAKPRIATTLKAENVEVVDVFEAIGVTNYVAGKSAVEAELNGNAASQKELVESLNGNVRMKMSKGAIIGYDFSDVIGGFFEWLSGDLRYDPKRRSPFDKLEADMKVTNGVAKSNTMRVDGPVISLTSDGTAKLPAREIDYRARVSLAAWFKPIAVRIFGDWQKPSKAVDVFDFTRNPGVLASPMDVFRNVDLKDAELAQLAGELLARSNERPLPPQVKEFLEALKTRAGGG